MGGPPMPRKFFHAQALRHESVNERVGICPRNLLSSLWRKRRSSHVRRPNFGRQHMLTIQGGGQKYCDGLSRRSFLQIGGLAMGGLALPDILRAEAASGKRR